MRKYTPKSVASDIVLVQSLEGTPKIGSRSKARLILVSYKDSDQAVKNQMLDGAESFHVDGHYEELDSTQLRKYFEDQQIIIDYLDTSFPKDRLVETSSPEELLDILVPPSPEVTLAN
jgi:hypothetical protein